MKKNNKKLKAIVLSLGLGAAMLTAPSVKAQGVFGDMLDNYYAEKEQSSQGGGALLRGSTRETPNVSGEFGNFGVGEAPLGSGVVIMLLAGAGYVALKKKED